VADRGGGARHHRERLVDAAEPREAPGPQRQAARARPRGGGALAGRGGARVIAGGVVERGGELFPVGGGAGERLDARERGARLGELVDVRQRPGADLPGLERAGRLGDVRGRQREGVGVVLEPLPDRGALEEQAGLLAAVRGARDLRVERAQLGRAVGAHRQLRDDGARRGRAGLRVRRRAAALRRPALLPAAGEARGGHRARGDDRGAHAHLGSSRRTDPVSAAGRSTGTCR
jgi:hypothetical protein